MSIAELKMFRGVPVPWVARWSDEVGDPRDLALKPNVVIQGDANPAEDWKWPLIEYKTQVSNRDELGVLWQMDGMSMTGEPQFGQVNALRQVSCMRFKRCQVCGHRIKTDTLLFLVPDVELQAFRTTQTTTTPPVCAECAEEAPKLCPALMRGNSLIRVQSMHPVAVFGELYRFQDKEVIKVGMTEVPLRHVAVRSIIGKQLVMGVTI